MKKLLKILGVLLLLLVLLVVSGVFVLNRYGTSALRQLLAEASGHEVELEQFRLGYTLSSLELNGLRLVDRASTDEVLMLKHLRITFNPLTLTREQPTIYTCAIDMPAIWVQKLANGGTNFDWVHTLGQPAPAVSPKPAPPTPPAAPNESQPQPQPEHSTVPPPQLPPATTEAPGHAAANIRPPRKVTLRLNKIRFEDLSSPYGQAAELELEFDRSYEDYANTQLLLNQIQLDLFSMLGGPVELPPDTPEPIPPEELDDLERMLEEM